MDCACRRRHVSNTTAACAILDGRDSILGRLLELHGCTIMPDETCHRRDQGTVTRGLSDQMAVLTKGSGADRQIPCSRDQGAHKPLVGSSNLPLATLPDRDFSLRWSPVGQWTRDHESPGLVKSRSQGSRAAGAPFPTGGGTPQSWIPALAQPGRSAEQPAADEPLAH